MTFKRSPGMVFGILLVPFLLNDLAFMALDGSYAIYVADYGFRLVVLAIALGWIAAQAPARQPRQSNWTLSLAIAAALLLPLLEYPADLIDREVDRITGLHGLFRYPPIPHPALNWLDLTLGLLLVAISEELVFRKLARRWLEDRGVSALGLILISAFILGVMHWGGGAGQVAAAFLLGLIYMWFHQRLERIWPLILAHWGHNFLAFGPLQFS